MTTLAHLLARQIEADGPMTVAAYMQACLMHPEHGYYVTRDPFGGDGDFVTAPEISQMFGELVGLTLAAHWQAVGSPANIVLAELGPGRGTLMADALRATRGVPGFHEAAQVHLVETSPTLRARQIETVGAVTHHDRIETLPDRPLFLIANEFFDALPIRQFVRQGTRWRERVVGLSNSALSFGLSDPMDVPSLAGKSAQDGDLIEVCAAGEAIAAQIGERLDRFGGLALIVDYGGWDSLGDTLQALRAHDFVDPLATPGEADLTAHVDFAALARAATPARHTQMTPQGVFLERLGITQRAQALAQSLGGAALESHVAAHRRLTHGDEMGTLFKAMALYPEGTSLPPGFAA